MGLFSRKGDTIAIKNDFYSFLLPHEKSGFTTSIASAYSDAQNSVLFKTGSNDTVFCISADRISAACVLDLKNSDAEVIRSLDVTDMSNLRIEKKDPKDIFVQDMIEFPAHYYFRLLYNQAIISPLWIKRRERHSWKNARCRGLSMNWRTRTFNMACRVREVIGISRSGGGS